MEINNKLIDGKYSYFAFICYTHDDYKEAAKLHRKLQRYGLPTRLRKETGKEKRLIPMFLDQEEMPSGSYETVDKKALEQSKFLIVVCSRNLKSHDMNVNQEIQDFLSFGNTYDQISPYIIDFDKDPVNACFPSELVRIKEEDNTNIIGPSIYTPSGKKDETRARLRVIAKIHDIKASELENEEHKRKRKNTITGVVVALLYALLLFVLYSYISYTKFPCEVIITERYDGTTTWYEETMDAVLGDTIEFQIEFINSRGFLGRWLKQLAESNNLEISSKNVMVRVVLPDNLEYIEDSTVVFNSNHREGVRVNENTLTTSGINIGSYKINGNAYVRFKCRTAENRPLPAESITWASVTIWPKDKSESSDEAIHVKDSVTTTICK